MLTITDAAFRRLNEMMGKLSGSLSLRMVRRDKRTKIKPGVQRPGDTEVTHNDLVVLRLGGVMANRLKDKVLDVRQTKDGPRLGLRGTTA